MRVFLLAALLGIAIQVDAQNNDAYFDLTMQAQKSMQKKEYKKAASFYTKAFRANSWKAYSEDRLGAARAWSMAGNSDSAFSQLNKLVTLYRFENYDRLSKDSALTGLQRDPRWKDVKDGIIKNIVSQEANVNSGLAVLLDSVYRDHQRYRFQAVIVKNRYGNESEESRAAWKVIHEKDSVNLSIVTKLVDQYGWLGTDVAGVNGNATLALVMLHAPLAVQEKYLPVMREAFKKGNVEAQDLAAMEDRVALRQGKKQIYGSNLISFDGKKYYISPMDDPAALDKRRAELGLDKMNHYLVNFGMKWDIERYKRELKNLEGKKIDY